MSLLGRFEEKYIPDPMSGCWLWLSAVNDVGRALFKFEGKTVAAARMSYVLYKGNLDKKFVLHSCDNPLCVNPDHLFLGTQKDNVIDCVKKKRHRNGSKSKKIPFI